MRTCDKCGAIKPFSEFTVAKARKDGYKKSCKSCCADYEKRRRVVCGDKIRARQRQDYAENPSKYKKWAKDWRSKNPQWFTDYYKKISAEPEYKEARAAYKRQIADAELARTALRRAACKQARLANISFADIRAYYKEAKRLTIETGIDHHVDHIVPLNGKIVCGLHVPWNLQVIPAHENLQKSNKMVEALALPSLRNIR